MRRIAILGVLMLASVAQATDYTWYVNTDAATDGDGSEASPFKTLSGAMSTVSGSKGSNLGTSTSHHTFNVYGATADSRVDVSTYFTNGTSDYHIHIICTNPHSGAWTTSKYRIATSTNYSAGLGGLPAYSEVYGIQVSSTGVEGIGIGVSNPHTTISRCIARGAMNPIRLASSDADYCTIENCILLGGTRGFYVKSAAYNNQLLQCTGINSSSNGVYCEAYSGLVAKNCYFACSGTGVAYYDAGTGLTLTKCYSDDGTKSTTTVACTTDTFEGVTAGSEDVHLVEDSDLLDVGDDLSASLIHDEDCDGEARPDGDGWDVGADEYEVVLVPIKATTPVPADGTVDVPYDVTLTWVDPNSRATSYNVYVRVQGEAWPAAVSRSVANYSKTSLTPGEVYEWRVDSVNGDGTTTGDTWDFTVFELPATVYYTSTDGDGDKTGDGEPNAMLWAYVDANTPADANIVIVGMDATINDPGADWPAGRTYYAETLHWYDQITVTLDQVYRVGRFVNRDLWVQNPVGVTLSTVSPAFDATDGNDLNGIQVNPVDDQGLDERAAYYDAALNYGNDLPLLVTPLSTVVFAASAATPVGYSRLDTMSVLTVVAAVPDANSFRPGIASYTGRAVKYNWSDVSLSFLPAETFSGLTTIHSDTPTDVNDYDETIERLFERPWCDWLGGNAWSRLCTAWQNQAAYGRETARDMSTGLIALSSDTATPKDVLAARMIQLGLDWISIAKARGVPTAWCEAEGHAAFRLAGMTFAAYALQDETLQAYLETIGPNMPEVRQCYHVSAADVKSAPYTLHNTGAYAYNTGTVTVTKGSVTVEGSGSNWPATKPDDYDDDVIDAKDVFFFGVPGDNRASDPFARVYTVDAWVDADTLTLTEPYDGEGGSGLSFQMGNRVYYGHAKYVKMDAPENGTGGDSYFDYGEYTTSMIGLPDWAGWFNQTSEYSDWSGPNFGGDVHGGTYRLSGPGSWVPAMLALHLMGLDDEYVTICGGRQVVDYLDRFVEFCQSQHELGDHPHGYGSDQDIYTWCWPAWTIDEWEACRADAAYAPAWSHKPTTPSPANGATGVSVTPTLSWTEKAGTYGVRLYLGTSSALDGMTYATRDGDTFQGIVTAEEYSPASLSPNTTYYWRVDYTDTSGDSVTGAVWSFTTDSGQTSMLRWMSE